MQSIYNEVQHATTVFQRAAACDRLDQLQQEFLSMASVFPLRLQFVFLCSRTFKMYGKIIINEVYLPDEKKTIKPQKLGGVGGGLKYCVHNIIFKFPLNIYNIYSDHDGAAKGSIRFDSFAC